MRQLYKKQNGSWVPVITGRLNQMNVAALLLHSGVAVKFKGKKNGQAH